MHASLPQLTAVKPRGSTSAAAHLQTSGYERWTRAFESLVLHIEIFQQVVSTATDRSLSEGALADFIILPSSLDGGCATDDDMLSSKGSQKYAQRGLYALG